METLLFLIIILLAVLLFLTIFSLNNISNRLSRITKRYNQLLRGRGEINIEELLIELSQDVDEAIDKVEYFEDISNELQDNLDKSTSNFVQELNSRISHVDSSISSRISGIESKYNSELDRINETFDGKIDHLEKSQSTFKTDFSKTTDKKLKNISEQLAFAVQKVALHKYNAFEHQTGHLSFTIVLLDRFNNGIMMTSINGRDQSYTYSKYIKNGQSEVEMSKDEQEALDMALDKK